MKAELQQIEYFVSLLIESDESLDLSDAEDERVDEYHQYTSNIATLKKNSYKNSEPLNDTEQAEIGRLIADGCTGGRTDCEDSCIAWDLQWNKWTD